MRSKHFYLNILLNKGTSKRIEAQLKDIEVKAESKKTQVRRQFPSTCTTNRYLHSRLLRFRQSSSNRVRPPSRVKSIILYHDLSDNSARSTEVGDTMVAEEAFACSALRTRILARSVSGLLITVSSLKRFRAETGGQLRIMTTSSFCNSGVCNVSPNSYCNLRKLSILFSGSCVKYFLVRSMRFTDVENKIYPGKANTHTLRVILCATQRVTVTVAVLSINPTFVTNPLKAIGGMAWCKKKMRAALIEGATSANHVTRLRSWARRGRGRPHRFQHGSLIYILKEIHSVLC